MTELKRTEIRISARLKTALQAEAAKQERSLNDYIYHLLLNRRCTCARCRCVRKNGAAKFP
jgi:predicted HicB family RNase H-like nuclease